MEVTVQYCMPISRLAGTFHAKLQQACSTTFKLYNFCLAKLGDHLGLAVGRTSAADFQEVRGNGVHVTKRLLAGSLHGQALC